MSDLKKRSTNINEVCRRKLDISRDEYALCSYIHYRCADSRQRIPGWCCDEKEEIASFVGVTRAGLYKMVSRLIVAELIEADGTAPFVWRVTALWIDTENECQLCLHHRVNKVDTRRKLSLHGDVNKVDTHIKVEYEIKNDIARKEEEAEKPLLPPFEKVDELSLEAEKNNPSPSPGRGAIRATIHDPRLPGTTIHDEIPIAPKTQPLKARQATRHGPHIHPENENVFAHFTEPDKARAAWLEWLDYKWREHRQKYKDAKSELTALRKIWKTLSGDSERLSNAVEHSETNLYKGIFESKEQKGNGQHLNKAQQQHAKLAAYLIERRQRAMERGDYFPVE